MFSRRALYPLVACAGASLALLPASCSGHHEGLAASGGGGGASVTTTGSGGTTTSASSVAASAQTSAATVSATSGGTGGMDAGPPGPTKVTVVDGVNDYSAVRICFTAYPSGADVEPWPKATGGLAFAHGSVIDPIADSIPNGVDVRPVVIAGDLATTAGLGCSAILALAIPGDAGSAPIVAIPLPVLPANVFTSGKSLLLVPTGCLGGASHTDPQQALACGMSYAPDSPTADLVALAMNRTIDPTHVSLQAVQAAPTMPVADLRLTPGVANAVEVQIAGSLTYGEAAPVPPFATLKRADYESLPKIQLTTYFPNTMYMSSVTPGSAVLANGNVTAAEFVDGAGFSLVAIGGYPGVPAGAWWHALTYALIRNDP